MSSTRCNSAPRLARWLWLVLVALAPLAQAQPPGKAHLERGLKLYRAGRYREAIAAFEKGYAVQPNPVFLLDLAQAWRQLGDLDRTRAYYQKFVEKTPPRNAAHVQALLALEKLDAQLRERDAAARAAAAKPEPVVVAPAQPAPAPVAPAPAPPAVATASPASGPPHLTDPTLEAPAPATVSPPAPTVAPVEPAPPRRSRAPGWAGLALSVLGAGALGAGGGFTALAVSANDRYLHPIPGTVYDPSLTAERDRDRTAAIATFTVGGVLVVTGVVLTALFLPRPTPKAPATRRRSLALVPGAGL